MRAPAALAALGLALAAAPAAQAARSYIDVPQGKGTESVTFQSDPATCAAVGRCGYSGTVTYSFEARGGASLIFEEFAGTVDATVTLAVRRVPLKR
jgi:hypothetical protein